MINQNRIPHIYHNTMFARKIFEIIHKKHSDMRKISDTIRDFNDLNKCYGYMLDIHGQNYQILRNGRDDDDYRQVLKFEMAAIKFLGSPEEIKNLLALYFNLKNDEIRLEEGSGKIYLKVPETISIDDVKERIAKIKGAGIGYTVDIDIYIEDFTLTELEGKTLDEIATITIARG